MISLARSTRHFAIGVRCFSALPGLHSPLQGLPAEQFAESTPNAVKVTTLQNGLKVATLENHSNMSSIQILVNAGARDQQVVGTAHVMQHLALQSTANRTSFRLIREAERLGANVFATANHDTLIFNGDVLRPRALDLLEFMSESVLQPAFNEWEVEDAVNSAIRDSEAVEKNTNAHICELLHATAYNGATLGSPLFSRKQQYELVTAGVVAQFWQSNLALDRLTIVGANVSHDNFVEVANKRFGSLPSHSQPRVAARYTGGDFRIESDETTTTGRPKSDEPTSAVVKQSDKKEKRKVPMTTVGLAFEGSAFKSADLVPVFVLSTILGGGDSFSAGGPGKGMLARLYTNVLGADEDIKSANHLNVYYSDSGLFGIYASAPSFLAEPLIGLLGTELKNLKVNVSAEELQRGKNQLKMHALSNADSHSAALEDLASQVHNFGRHTPVQDLMAKIDKVTATDIKKAAQKILSSNVTFVAKGQVASLPSYNDISSLFS